MTIDGFTHRTVLLTVALLLGLVGPPQVSVGQAFFDVQVNGTNSPITEGETLTVDASIENTGDQADTQTITLSIDGAVVDAVEVSLGNGESTTLTLNWTTSGGDAGDYSATVESEDASATTSVTVQEPPNFSVTIDATNSPVTEGETLDVTAFIENLGDATGTQTVVLDIDGSTKDSRSLTLAGGESSSVTLSWETQAGDAGDYTAAVISDNDSDSTPVSVQAPAFFSVTIDATNSPVTEGERLTVDATISNTGDQASTQTITLDIDGATVDETTVSLTAGESTIIRLEWATQAGDAGSYTATVLSNDASASRSVSVQEPPNFSVTIDATNSPVTEGETLDVTAFIENLGDATGTQTVVLDIDGSTKDSRSLTLAGGENQTLTLNWTTSDGDAGDYTATVTSDDDVASTSVRVDAPIPVELTSFTANTDDETVRLHWKTASETNNAGFEVQRRLPESSSWTALTFVEGEGSTTQPQRYQFRDQDVPYGADSLRYRLKQIDTDGTTSLSNEIVVTRRSPSEVALVGTYPNPTENRMTVRFAIPKGSANVGMLRLYDLTGREVRAIKVPTDAGRHKQTLTVSRLASGPYILRLEVGDETQTERVTVVR